MGEWIQKFFERLIKCFSKDTLIRYYDMKKSIYIFTDAQITGLGTMLAQGNTISDAKPVAVASKTTNMKEKKILATRS